MGTLSKKLEEQISKKMKENGVKNPETGDTAVLAKAIAESLTPIFEGLITSINAIDGALPKAFTSIGAGPAAAGPAGAGSYSGSATPKVKKSLASAKTKLNNL